MQQSLVRIDNSVLRKKLDEIINIVNRPFRTAEEYEKTRSTGFIPYNREALASRIKSLRKSIRVPPKSVSFDLGCGDGCWTLMAAAAGYNSYGIDVNPFLIDIARKNYDLAVERGLISKHIECKFAEGNVYHGKYMKAYRRYFKKTDEKMKRKKQTMPLIFTKDPYEELGVSLNDADIVYSYPWPEAVKFQYNFFNKEIKKGTILVLPWGMPYPLNAERICDGPCGPLLVRKT